MATSLESPALRHVVLLATLTLLWSSSFTFIKVGVATVPPLTMAAVRVVMAAAILWTYAGLRGMPVPRSLRFWAPYFLLAIFGNSLPFFLVAWGEAVIDSALAAILIAVMPLVTIVLAHQFTEDERLSVPKVLGVGVGLGFAGVVTVVGADALRGLGDSVWRQLAVAGSATCYAISAVFVRRAPAAPTEVRAAVVLTCASLQLVPAALLLDWPLAVTPTAASMGAVIYLGLMSTALATIIYFRLIAARGATFVSFNNYMGPPVGVLLGALFLGERPPAAAIGGMAMILAGVGLASLWRRG